MTRKLFLALLALSVLWLAIGCAGGPERPETISGIDALIEEITWGILDGLPEGPEKTLAVSYFTVEKETSPISDYLINGLTTSLAGAGKGKVKVVSRQVLDRLLAEASFQMSDLVDKETQIRIGKQLGADLILTGFITPLEERFKVNAQLVEVETGVVVTGLILDFQPERDFERQLAPETSETVLVKREKIEVAGTGTLTTLIETFDRGAPEIQLEHAEDSWGDRVRSSGGEITIQEGSSLDGSSCARFAFEASLDSTEVLNRWQDADLYFLARFRTGEKIEGYDGLNLALKAEGFSLLNVDIHQERKDGVDTFYVDLSVTDGEWREYKLPFSRFFPAEKGLKLDPRKPVIVAISVPFLENWARYSFRTGTDIRCALSLDNIGYFSFKQAEEPRIVETFNEETERLPWRADIYGSSIYTDYSKSEQGEEKLNPGIKGQDIRLSRKEGGAAGSGRYLNLEGALELTGKIKEYHQAEQTLTLFLKSHFVKELKGFQTVSLYVRSDLFPSGTLELQDLENERYYYHEFGVSSFWSRVKVPLAALTGDQGSLADAVKSGRWSGRAQLFMNFAFPPKKLEQAGTGRLEFELALDDILLEP